MHQRMRVKVNSPSTVSERFARVFFDSERYRTSEPAYSYLPGCRVLCVCSILEDMVFFTFVFVSPEDLEDDYFDEWKWSENHRRRWVFCIWVLSDKRRGELCVFDAAKSNLTFWILTAHGIIISVCVSLFSRCWLFCSLVRWLENVF